MQCYHIVVLICIFLTTNDFEHLKKYTSCYAYVFLDEVSVQMSCKNSFNVLGVKP